MRKRKTKTEIHIRFSKRCENEIRSSKPFFKVSRKRKTKSKIQICFSMSCEKEKCKWHLNSIFPCHRKTVGTKVHAFVSFTYLKPHQEAKETKYEISLNIMSRSRDPLSGKETLLTRFQIQIKVKKWSSSCKYLLQKKIKAEVIVPFQNILSSMPDFRDVVSVLPCN